MKKFEVVVKVEGYFSQVVEAENEEKAISAFKDLYKKADFNELKNPEMNDIRTILSKEGVYEVTGKMTGSCSGSVIANDERSAKELAQALFDEEADYGELYCYNITEVIITNVIE